jgi:hypothetical protein
MLGQNSQGQETSLVERLANKSCQYLYINLLKTQRFHHKDWHDYPRMQVKRCLILLSVPTALIERRDTCLRQALSAYERITGAVRFVMTGRTLKVLKLSSVIIHPARGKK